MPEDQEPPRNATHESYYRNSELHDRAALWRALTTLVTVATRALTSALVERARPQP